MVLDQYDIRVTPLNVHHKIGCKTRAIVTQCYMFMTLAALAMRDAGNSI